MSRQRITVCHLIVFCAALAPAPHANGSEIPVPPTGWAVYPGKRSDVTIESNPLCVKVNGSDPITVARQLGLRLNPESTYRLSCSVKAEGLEADKATGVQVINAGWTWSSGALRPEQATSDWIDLRKEFKPRPSSDEEYALVVRGATKGILYAKNVRIELVRGEPAPPPPDPGDPNGPYLDDDFLVNGGLLATDEENPFPEGWSVTAGAVLYDKTGGRSGHPALVIRNPGGVSVLRQAGVPLIPGGKYRLTGYYKTKGFDGAGGVFVINRGWAWTGGFSPGKGTVDWTRFEREFTVPRSETYQFVFYAKAAGELAVCDLKLQGHHPPPKVDHLYNVYPLSDVHAIDTAKPVLTLGFPYLCGQAAEAGLECRVTLKPSSGAELTRTAPVKDGTAVVALEGAGAGTFTVRAAIVDTGRKATLCSNEFTVTLAPAPALDLSGVRRLNNLVMELTKSKIPLEAGAPREVRFPNPRYGWVFVSVTPGAESAIRVAVSGAAGEAIEQVAGPGRAVETFRLLPQGMGRILISARQACTVELVVKAVPELLFDAPNYNPWKVPVRALGKFDWPFIQKHVLPAFNGFVRGSFAPENLAVIKAAGLRWLTNESLQGVKRCWKGPLDLDQAAGCFLASDGFTKEKFDGVCVDEFILSEMPPHVFAEYARVLDRLQRDPARAKLVYPWVAAGAPTRRAFYADFFSSLARNRGKAIFEAYCRELPTEEQAAREIETFLAGGVKAYGRAYPDIQRHMVFGIGISSQMFDWPQTNFPEVDRKYYLDMQMALLANHKNFKDLYGVAVYTSGHSDEETVRWITRLFRHYAVDGNTEMLSPRYGFSYRPGHLDNGDFADGTKGWTCTPAPDGAIKTGAFKGYGGTGMQGRWQCQGEGDTFLVLRRGARGPNKVARQIANLVPGKLYAFHYVVADRAGFNGAAKPEKVVFRADIDGIEPIADKSFCHLQKAGLSRGNVKVYPTWGRIVFRAKQSVASLTLSDWESETKAGGPVGQELVLNFVQCVPYYEP